MSLPEAGLPQAQLELLKKVARSFYLSLRWLPPAVRGPMSLAYLLARASDTIADAGAWPAHERTTGLTLLVAAVRDPTISWTRGDLIPADEDTVILAHLPALLHQLHRLPPAERALVQEVMVTITQGQLEDIQRAEVGSMEELERYTFQVAGCVGEFWTKLCVLKLPHFARAPVASLRESGIRFGKGLQLVNILRDIAGDAALGRSYLPGLPVTSSVEQRWAAAQPWLRACRDSLLAGREYAVGINGIRNRLVVLLPYFLAEATLDLIVQTGSEAMGQSVKIPRAAVRRLAASALRTSIFG